MQSGKIHQANHRLMHLPYAQTRLAVLAQLSDDTILALQQGGQAIFPCFNLGNN
jgi:hypothetical protein